MPARVLAFLLAAVATTASAQIRTWVSPAGMDSNPCTRDLPCRSLLAGINVVVPGGEVVAMESGGYGAVTISKSVALVAPQGVHAAIAPTSGNAVTVAAGASDHVIVRNLYLQNNGANYGIDVDSVGALYVESCTVSSFGTGIRFEPTTPGARLYVSDTTLRDNNFGVEVGNGTSLRATLDSVQVHSIPSGIGISIEDAQATIIDSVVTGGSLSVGFRAGAGAQVILEDSTASHNGFGYNALAGAVMILTRCAATANGVGIESHNFAAIYVSDSAITENTTAVDFFNDGELLTRLNNTVEANPDPGAFSDTFAPH